MLRPNMQMIFVMMPLIYFIFVPLVVLALCFMV